MNFSPINGQQAGYMRSPLARDIEQMKAMRDRKEQQVQRSVAQTNIFEYSGGAQDLWVVDTQQEMNDGYETIGGVRDAKPVIPREARIGHSVSLRFSNKFGTSNNNIWQSITMHGNRHVNAHHQGRLGYHEVDRESRIGNPVITPTLSSFLPFCLL